MRKLTIIIIVIMSINCFADIDSLSVQTSIDSIRIMIRDFNRTISEFNEQIQNNIKEMDLLRNRIVTIDEKSLQMKQTIDQIRIENKNTKEKIIAIGIEIQTQKDSFNLGISSLNEEIKTTENEINDRIDKAEMHTQKVSVSLSELIKKNIFKFLLICTFLLLISILVYIFTRKKLK